MAEASEQTVASKWQDQATWSKTASRLKNDISRWRTVAVVAGVSGAGLETLAATLSALDERWWWLSVLFALAGAAVLAMVPIVLQGKVSRDHVERWVSARTASEALKETIFRYLAKARPFDSDPAPTQLVQRCQAIMDRAAHLGLEVASVKAAEEKSHKGTSCPKRLAARLASVGHARQPTDGRTNPQQPPKAPDKPVATLAPNDYIELRVRNQINDYYEKAAQKNANAAGRLRALEFGLGLLGAAMGAAAACAAAARLPEMSLVGAWVGVVTTWGAAVSSHLAASGYEHQAMTYQATAFRLKGLLDLWEATHASGEADPDGFRQFVDDCEHAISIQNEAWVAEWRKREKDKQAAQ